jgi:aryl-alcohol dehydrogenase-like predicted oxidoreductase
MSLELEETDMRRWDDRWQGNNYAANLAAIGALSELADKGIAVTQLALAWLLA